MSGTTLGSQSSDSARTPTLRQFYKQNNGTVPNHSFVKLIFKPGKSGGYGLLTDHNFRVTVLEDNPLYGILRDQLVMFADNEDALFVRILDGSKGSFELYLSDTETASWEEMTWGFKATLNQKTDPQKKPTTGRAKS